MRFNQATICDWAASAFGPATDLAGVLACANDELAEGLRAVTGSKPFEEVAEEVADVAIVLCRAASLAHIELRRVEDGQRTEPGTRGWRSTYSAMLVGSCSTPSSMPRIRRSLRRASISARPMRASATWRASSALACGIVSTPRCDQP
jgi:hypothetical protein